MRAFGGDRVGSTGLIFAAAIVPITFLAGAGIDYARAVNAREKLQSALDNALLAAAHRHGSSAQSAWHATANTAFNSNALEIADYNPSATFASAGEDTFNGSGTADVKGVFAGVVGLTSFPLEVTSSVVLSASENVCILLVDANASEALRVNSGAEIIAPDCELHVRSTAERAANFNAGIDLQFSRICIKGPGTTNNAGPIAGLVVDCAAAENPFDQGVLPAPPSTSCDHSNLNYNGGTVQLTPGVYCGWVNFNNSVDVEFAPGVYVIRDGGWNVNGGSWQGDGVTFYFHDTSKIQFNSGVTADLAAPLSGRYSGILMYEKDGLPQSHFVLDDSRGFDATGLIHLPSRDAIYNAGSTIHGRSMTMVFNTLILNNTKWQLVSADKAIQTGSSKPRLAR